MKTYFQYYLLRNEPILFDKFLVLRHHAKLNPTKLSGLSLFLFLYPVGTHQSLFPENFYQIVVLMTFGFAKT